MPTEYLERTGAETWLAAAIERRGGLVCIPDWHRWLLYEAAKRRLNWRADYEARTRKLAAMLDARGKL